MRRNNADPDKGVAFYITYCCWLQKIGKKFSVSYPNNKIKNHMVPTSLHGATFGDQQNQLLTYNSTFYGYFLFLLTKRNLMKQPADSP